MTTEPAADGDDGAGTSGRPRDDDRRVIALDDDDADELFALLSKERYRAILRSLHDRPATADELAARLDVTPEGAGVALDRLQEAGLVEPTETTDPTAGETTTVYRPTERTVVSYDGGDPPSERLVRPRLVVAAGGVLLAGSVAFHLLAPGESTAGVPTGLVFFAGGLIVLVGWTGLQAVSE